MAKNEAGAAADAQHEALGQAGRGSGATHTMHPEAQWFPKAGLGLFLHWGIASVIGKVDLSWGMIDGKPWGGATITPREYYALADRFDPDNYDPDRWLSAAARAGFKYAVLTTKHHDGYTMWPTDVGELGVRTHLGGRDLVKPFVEACRRNGLKVGLYYSPPDWYFAREHMSFGYDKAWLELSGSERKGLGLDHEPRVIPEAPPEHAMRRVEMVRAHVTDLLTRFGRIDLFWFDGGRGEMTSDEVRAMQPHVVVNDRNDGKGDYGHTECRMPGGRFETWFETCDIWSHGGWGYCGSDEVKSVTSRLEELAVLRAWGGNLLTNLGVRPDGEVPLQAYERFDELAAWMDVHGDAIYDIAPGRYPEECNAPETRKGEKSFLFLLPKQDGAVVVKGAETPRKATLMRTGAAVSCERSDDGVSFAIPSDRRAEAVEVIQVEW